MTGKRMGRPPTIGGKDEIHIRVSPEMMAKVRAFASAHHVTTSESVRLMLQVLMNSPEDTITAMVKDPAAQRSEFVVRQVDDAGQVLRVRGRGRPA